MSAQEFLKQLTQSGQVDKPGLVVLVGPTDARYLPPGAQLILVPDPERLDRATPVFLAKLTREKLVFRCNCGNPRCTRVLEYTLAVKGEHPKS